MLVIDRRRRFIFRVRRGGVQGSDKGILFHDDIIGLPYGSRVRLSSGVEAIVHKPTVYDFIEYGFRRKSQVIYPKDLGLILILAGITPGARVVEIGVGSGFTTAVLASIVGDEGRVYSYEIREDMVETAKQNLEKAGLLGRVVFHLSDAREGIEERDVDAVVVDMPDPWSILDHAYESLRPSGSLIVFVPSINQAIRMVSAINNHVGFDEPRVYEVLMREYQPEPDALRPYTTMVGFTGLILWSRKVVLKFLEKAS